MLIQPSHRNKSVANNSVAAPLVPLTCCLLPVFQRNEPNFILRAAPNAQNEPNSPPQKMQNEPNLPNAHHPPAQKYETNPIYTSPSLAHDPNMRNEPNLPPRAAFSTFASLLSTLSRATARAAQFTPPSTIHNIQYTVYNPLAQFPDVFPWGFTRLLFAGIGCFASGRILPFYRWSF